MRKPIPKKLRQQVYEKYGGHCAYCGKKIEYKDMQVDHADITYGRAFYGMDTKRAQEAITDNSINDIENLMPACRQCNFYKGMDNIDYFRRKIKNTLEHSCVNTFQAKLAMQYGIIKHHEWDGLFYFEKEKEK